jgi:hypothetical protein
MLGNLDLRSYLSIIKPSLRIAFFYVTHIRKPTPDRVEIWDRRRSLLPLLGKLNNFQRRPFVIFQSCVSSKSNI